jgi:hypothetical protein
MIFVPLIRDKDHGKQTPSLTTVMHSQLFRLEISAALKAQTNNIYECYSY